MVKARRKDGEDDDDSSLKSTPYKPYALKDVFKASKKELFTVVSTFAGGGGSSTGYKLAGGKVCFVNEFIPAAIRTYELNYPDVPVIKDDIRVINRNSGKVIKRFAEYGVRKGELDIFDGSPPCKTFSRAKGKIEVESDEYQKYSDTTQKRIGMLIHDYVYIANVIQPKVCILENVPQIAASPVFAHALERLRRYDYRIAYKTLVASNFGVAQKRERLFLIAIRPDIADAADIHSDEDVMSVFPEPETQTVTLRSALSGLVVNERERQNLLLQARSHPTSYQILKALPLNPAKPTKPQHIIPNWRSDWNWIRASWDFASPTITAEGAQGRGRGGVNHPEEHRSFTTDELKRIMGLPDDFKFRGTPAQNAERQGRMCPPLLTKAIATAVYQKVLKPAMGR